MTGDDYLNLLKNLLDPCQRFIAHEDADEADTGEMHKAASYVRQLLRNDGYRPREKMTRADVFRNGAQRLSRAIEEYLDLVDYEGGELGLNVWDGFERAVKSAARTAKDEIEWAPEDDSNPIKVVPVPTPDPTAPPINGVRQGDYVKASFWDEPRKVLTGPNGEGRVRVSDPRDGAANFGGYFVEAKDLGVEYLAAEPVA